MPDALLASIQDWLKDHESDLLADYRRLLQFPSIQDDPQPNAPFGKANRDALDFMLSLSSESGMATKDLEGFCGFAEFGGGEKMVMSLGHLDVVPVGPGWKHEPFGAEVDEGYVYARGAVDDKGPTMASFFAMRAIQACWPDVPVRMRSVFGCNEESGFQCVERYMKTEEAPTFGVAPDSGWPLYHAEKGIANLVVVAPRPKGDVELLSIEGGQRPNIVIDSCTAKVRVGEAARTHVESKIADGWDKNLTAAWEGDVLTVQAHGKAAHGSTPYYGDSAAIRALRFLREVTPLPDQQAFDALFKIPQTQGEGVGIEGADEVSGALSCNLGVISSDANSVRFLLNVRYPVVWKGDDMKARCEKKMAKLGQGFRLESMEDSPSLYFPLEHPMVRIVCEVYEQETGEKKEPGVMGGGTYARAVPNTVSIGTGWPGDGPAHETDERLKVEHLNKMARIYAHVLYRLAKECSN
ncbi:MAG TPA: Sapep family Mn(2+)-dependent dipeptidase [Fimbriimonadaceae bacterium]|nr:Sapep family Mn(2+)-dependent dipeptidase [Fimbriimonadaceae bacterium]